MPTGNKIAEREINRLGVVFGCEIPEVETSETMGERACDLADDGLKTQIVFIAGTGHIVLNGKIALNALIQRTITRHAMIGAHNKSVGCLDGIVGIKLYVAAIAGLVIGNAALGIEHGKVGIGMQCAFSLLDAV